ncbi:molybdenum cofactor cytidylyltransferase [Clostridium tagluense]|nr:molybdenum cofactor cytidylyltransferase [Clostridium tagluense]MCB2321982.1 molybdenum cofactor cytidylyltransferase [Clostridium tagluense]MCB2336493.1 molybdenum cofactor cytidylyltransferase [Clostridium tagluense]MCB2365372.1 molybdenum cofactor cytidylyltransferase [Clostridium tagluense]
MDKGRCLIMVSAIILAAGYSRRMGKNKLLLKYRGKSLIQRTIETIEKCDFSEVILVGREEEIIETGNRYGLVVIKNENANKGISESIKLGVMQAGQTEGYMFFTADQPFLDRDTVKRLIREFTENPAYIIVPRCDKSRGNPVIFPYSLKEEFLQLQGDVGGKLIINKNLDKVKFVEISDSLGLFDIDTNENYEYILKLEENNEYV